MGSNLNFKNFGNEPPGDGSGSSRPNNNNNNNYPLTRQPSIYSLTIDEFQTTLGGMGKDFGSMNMDELLKNIYSAEETQSMAAAAAAAAAASVADGGGYLQRQGSLTLPRTLSQKTVDEVWRDITNEFSKDGGTGPTAPQRQQTLGEMTLEEFLVRAGVVREDAQLPGKNPNSAAVQSGIFGDLARVSNSSNHNNNNSSNSNSNHHPGGGFGINFQQPGRGVEFMSNRIPDNTNLPLNVNGVRSSQHNQQPPPQQQPQQPPPHQQPPHQQPLFPKQTGVSYAQLGSPGIRGGLVGLGDPGMNSPLVPGGPVLPGGGMGMVGLGGGGAIGVPAGSPAALSSDGLAKSNGDTSSVSPVPYVFNGGIRGRKCNNTVDKVVERRQRRMIKNRESAARSRARKQAYTMELEQEVQKLKEENQELRKKQAEIMEMQKNQVMEMMNAQSGPRKRLRRTQTGPW